MPKIRDHKHPVVAKLPKNAVTVDVYAASKNVTTPYIYKLVAKVRKGDMTEEKAGFKLVVFHGINFIIPV